MSAAILAAASGYVLKQITGNDLVDSVHRVAEGQSLIDPALTARVLDRLRHGEPVVKELAGLNERERQVLELVAEGLTNRQIGERLFLAEKTVKNYESRMLEKLGMERRTQAAVLAAARSSPTPCSRRARRPRGQRPPSTVPRCPVVWADRPYPASQSGGCDGSEGDEVARDGCVDHPEAEETMRTLLISAVTGTVLSLAAFPALGNDSNDSADYGQHVRTCAQTMGFDGHHNPGMHQGFSGWDPAHRC